jgi:CheY-like chemotaxis protein
MSMTIQQEQRCPLVLVVEDDDFLRLASSCELAENGFDTLVARSADEAVAILDEHESIDALFTDICMPGSMNGVALAHHVRERRPHAFLVITSGEALPQGEALPRNSRFVPKPYTMPDIAAMIRENVADE